ncbi:TRAP transporter small permease [Paracoccus pantotrophus]|nr:TRAP transporter small permease [Paracoccus pantotrophus]
MGTANGGGHPSAKFAVLWDRLSEEIVRIALICSCICLASLIAIGTIDTLGRLVSRPLLSSTEMSEALLATAFFLALPTVQRNRAHVVVDILKQKFGAKLRYISEVSALLLGAVIFWFLMSQGLIGAHSSAKAGEVAAGLIPIPVWIAKCASALGLVITFLEALRQCVFIFVWPELLPEPVSLEQTDAEEEQ